MWNTPKTWERRSVPFPAALADELAALMVGKGRDELAFTDQRGGVLRVSNYRTRVFAPAVKRCQRDAKLGRRRVWKRSTVVAWLEGLESTAGASS